MLAQRVDFHRLSTPSLATTCSLYSITEGAAGARPPCAARHPAPSFYTHTRTRTSAHTARQHARAHTKTERAPPPRQRARRVHGPLARQGTRHHLSLKHLRWVFLCRTFVGCGVSLQHLCRVFCLRGRFLLPCFFSAFWFCFPNEVNKATGRYFIAFLLSGLQSTLTR